MPLLRLYRKILPSYHFSAIVAFWADPAHIGMKSDIQSKFSDITFVTITTYIPGGNNPLIFTSSNMVIWWFYMPFTKVISENFTFISLFSSRVAFSAIRGKISPYTYNFCRNVISVHQNYRFPCCPLAMHAFHAHAQPGQARNRIYKQCPNFRYYTT